MYFSFWFPRFREERWKGGLSVATQPRMATLDWTDEWIGGQMDGRTPVLPHFSCALRSQMAQGLGQPLSSWHTQAKHPSLPCTVGKVPPGLESEVTGAFLPKPNQQGAHAARYRGHCSGTSGAIGHPRPLHKRSPSLNEEKVPSWTNSPSCLGWGLCSWLHHPKTWQKRSLMFLQLLLGRLWWGVREQTSENLGC